MKRFYFAMFLTVIFIILSVIADAYIERTNTELTALLSDCLIYAEKESLSEVNDTCKKADDLWSSRKKIYSFLVHTEKTDAFNDNFEMLQTMIISEDYGNIKILSIQCIQKLEDISESEKISIDNILKMTAVT